MGELLHVPRRRRRARWYDAPERLRQTVRDEHRDCWREDYRAA